MTKSSPSIKKFMTPSPHTIGRDQTLSFAQRILREHDIRHLPVLEGGKLVGVVSERDVALVEALRDVDPTKVEVGEAMSANVFAVEPGASLDEVAAEMASRKYGCAVVVDHGKVVGVFTTIDALAALRQLLGAKTAA